MALFKYGWLNRKANKQLVETLIELVLRDLSNDPDPSSFSKDDPLLKKINQALLDGADPNLSINDRPTPALIWQDAHPLSVAISCGNDKLVEMLLEHGATKTGLSGPPARTWFQQAIYTFGHPEMFNSHHQEKRQCMLNMGHMLMKHDFVIKSLHDDQMFSDYRIYHRFDPGCIREALQILFDASDYDDIVKTNNTLARSGTPNWSGVIRECLYSKHCKEQQRELTNAVSQAPNVASDEPSRKRKM